MHYHAYRNSFPNVKAILLRLLRLLRVFTQSRHVTRKWVSECKRQTPKMLQSGRPNLWNYPDRSTACTIQMHRTLEG